MAPQSEQQDLAIAWKALEAVEQSTGWRTIPLAFDGHVRILAARRFPGKEEALLVGFRRVSVPPAQHLPQGKGFAVERVDPGTGGIWIALSREGSASLTLFSLMAQDLIAVLATSSTDQEDALLFAFLARVRAWQDFMQKGTDGVIGPEEEVGLLGELLVLLALLRVPVEPTLTIEAWQGPLDGVHDFVLGTGAIEVKTTLAVGAFPAVIASLDQLDDSARRPLYLAAVRSSLSAAGKTLPDLVTDVRHELSAWAVALSLFNIRLLRTGFLDALSYHYVRRFSPASMSLVLVTPEFPRLTRATVAQPIRRATYELDLDLVRAEPIPLPQTLQHLGVV